MVRILILCIGLLFSVSIWAQDTRPLQRVSQTSVDPSWNVFDVWGYTDPITEKQYALMGASGIVVFDVTDKYHPVQVGKYNTDSDFDVKTWSNYAYGVSGGYGPDKGIILDLTDPANPDSVGFFDSAHNIYIDDQGFMYASNPNLRIYDLKEDPTHPKLLWENGSEGHDVVVKNDLLFDFHGYVGTFIYDVSDRANPVLVSQITDPGIAYHHSGDLTEDGQFLLINDELAIDGFDDITVWDISDFDDPQRVGGFRDSTATVHNIFIFGQFAYTSYYSAGMRIFDVSYAPNMFLVEEYDTSPYTGLGYTGSFGIFPFHGLDRIYVSDRDSGLMIFSTVTEQLEVEAATSTVGEGNIKLMQYENGNQIRLEALLPNAADIQVDIYDAAGRLTGSFSATGFEGYFREDFFTLHFAPGVYLLRIHAGDKSYSEKMVVPFR